MTCTHDKLETLAVNEEYVSYAAWKRTVETVRCLECKTEMRVDSRAGRIEQLKFHRETDEQARCLHALFAVDDRSIAYQHELERDSDVARIVLNDNIKYRRYWLAVATCRDCAFKFYVRSFFEEKTEGDVLTVQRKTPWRPVKRRFGENAELKYVPYASAEQ